MTVVSHNVSTRLQVTERTDTDGDSLWDAWENKTYQFDKSFLLSGRSGVSAEFSTDWQDPDTDGDGYWDGWIGVYNVSYDYDRGIPYADNVVLYREHLQSDGISGDETVSKQADLHHTDEVASAVGADIDRVDDNKEHSTIHIGELQWGSDPDDGENVPDTGISIEVDFTVGVQQSFNSSSWETAVEENFGLFGISVDLKRDETVAGPNHDLNTDLYTLVGSNATGLLPTGFLSDKAQEKIEGSTAWNFERTIEDYQVPVVGVPKDTIVLSEPDIRDDASDVSSSDRKQSPYRLDISVAAGMTMMHEVGHSLEAGESDDNPGRLPHSEVYSGSGADGSPEFVNNGVKGWSILRRGYGRVNFGVHCGRRRRLRATIVLFRA